MSEESFDVVVVGGGGAGLAAASEAARAGASVVLLEKCASLGGSTVWAVGSVTATGTPHQREAGIVDDSPQAHFEDLGKFAGRLEPRDNSDLRRVLVDNAPAMFGWLQAQGLAFSGPALERPHRWPRMHNVVPSSQAFVHRLRKTCLDLGVELRVGTRVRSLHVEGDRVAGVDALEASGAQRLFRARRGVVLATGDFSGSKELKSRFASELAAGTAAVNEAATGDGHTMALALGATVVNGDLVHGPIMRFVPPKRRPLFARIPPYPWIAKTAALAMAHAPRRLVRPILMSFVTTALGPDPGLFRAGAFLVNARGERFTDELGEPAKDLVRQPEGHGYIVLDGKVGAGFTAWPNFVSTAPNVAYAYLPDYRRNRRDVYHQATTVAALAGQLGMDGAALESSFASAKSSLRPPFIALGPVRSYIVVTEGGLRVSSRHEVLGKENRPIRGLFAAGAAGQGGLLLFGHGHHLGWAFVSGLRAGRYVAEAGA